VKRALVGTIVAAMLFSAAVAGATTVINGFLAIGGPKKLKVVKKLKIPVACAVECDILASSTLKIPGHKFTASTSGHLQPSVPKVIPLKLIGDTAPVIRDHLGGSKLIVRVTATDSSTGQQVNAHKTFGFKK
jgi:hypothetical protein